MENAKTDSRNSAAAGSEMQPEANGSAGSPEVRQTAPRSGAHDRTAPAAAAGRLPAWIGSRRPDAGEAFDLLDAPDFEDLLRAAGAVRDEGHPEVTTFSPKVFIPLTELCRDVCHY